MKSVVSYPERGPWGDSHYRGNCSGYLIKDIIEQYNIKSLSDYMVGSGTTEDVCKDLNVDGTFLDLNRGFDMLNMDIPERPENLFWHPPYGSIIGYRNEKGSCGIKNIDKEKTFGIDGDKCDLSRNQNWDDFVKEMNYCLYKQFTAMEKGGRMFVLMGDIKKKGVLYSMLANIAKPGTLEQIIIKMQHNCVSNSNTYANNNFVPIVHEYLMVLRKDSSLIIPIYETIKSEIDVRKSYGITWRDMIHAIIENNKEAMSLSEIYGKVSSTLKARNNPHWKDKVRQTVQDSRYFKRIRTGTYQAA